MENKSRIDEQQFQDEYYQYMAEVYKDAESLRTEGGAMFNDLDTYFEQDHLSDDDKALLAQLDAIDVTDADMVEFTDEDLVHNAQLLGTMSKLKGHANNVNCASYTYVINVYTKDPVSSVFKYTRMYETPEPIHEQLVKMFSAQNFIHRSNTTCFGDEKHEYPRIEIEQRAVKVYDLIVDENFDIDAPFYYYPRQLQLEPWEVTEEYWSSELDPNFQSLSKMNKLLCFKHSSPHKIEAHYMVKNSILSDKDA